MFVDTSAIVAIICGEAEADSLSDRIEAAVQPFTSPLVRLEACLVLASKLNRDPLDVETTLDIFLDEASISILPITDEIARLAVGAFQRFGKGRGSAARLNLADCMSYASAMAQDAPILFTGRDFSRTDLKLA